MDPSERTGRLEQLTLALGEALTEAAVAQVVLQHAVPALGADAGSISRLSPGASILELIGWTGYSDEIALFRRFSVEQRVPHALVVKRGEPMFLEDRMSMILQVGEMAASWPEPGSRDGVGAIATLPLQAGGRIFGAMGVSFSQPRLFSDDDRTLALMVSRLCAQALQRAQAFERELKARRESEAAQAQLEVLVNASAQLLGTLDQERICQALAELAVTAGLAEFASVELLEGEVVKRVAVHARDPVWLALEKRRLEFPQRVMPNGDAVERAMLSRSLQFASVLEASRRAELFHEDGWKMVAHRFHLRSRLVVPLLTAGQQPLGALNLLTSALSGREVGPRDLVLATELSSRAAVALHNARLYAQAREAVGLRDDFLSIAGHELRTPLTALKLQLQSSLRLMESPEGQGQGQDRQRLATVAERTERAARQVDRLQALVERLLDVSRISAGRFALEPELLSLDQVAREVCTRFAEEAASSGCKLTLRASEAFEGLAVVGQQSSRELNGLWDRMRIEQLIGNLLANAIKYGRGRPVEIGVFAQDGFGLVRVRDQGVGIAPVDQARVFDRFERAASAHRELGLGLGLWISRQIAEAHGGRIQLTSALGKGAEFVVSLPLYREAD